MKHFLVMLAVSFVGSAAAIAVPFWGVLMYYSYATLRPQYLWEWSLSQAPTIRWSLMASLVALGSTMVNLPTVLRGFRANKVFLLLLVYATLMLMSTLTAFDPSTSKYWVQEYGKVFLMAVVATLVIQRFWQVRAMGVMIAVCLGYLAYEVNFMYFFMGRLDIYHHGYGGLDNNGAGALLILGLPFAYFLAASPVGSWSRGRRLFATAMALVILHAVMMTYSRGAMVTGVFGLIWLLLHHRPRVQAAALSAFLACAVMVMAGQEIRDRFVSTVDYENDASALSRFDSWDAASEIALAHPLLGTGVRNSNAYSQNYGADRAGRTIHNQYLQIAADSGIPAAMVYITMIGLAVFGLGRARKKCIKAERAVERGPDPTGPHDRQALIDRTRDASALCLAIQAALAMFAFSGVFLSVELVEVPWLLIMLGGVLPAAVDRRLAGLGLGEGEADEEPAKPPPHKFGQDLSQMPDRLAA